MQVPRIGDYGSFTAFSATYELATAVLQTRSDWARLADEILADAAAEGCVHIEPAFWAGRYRTRFGSDRETWAMVIEEFSSAAQRHGVSINFISAIDRVIDDQAASIAVAELAVELKPLGVTGLGLHNNEIGHPPTDFIAAFAVAREDGLMSVPHAGELDEGRHVRDAVELLGAVRIAHGVRAAEAEGLVEQLAQQQVCLDICPTSNRLLGVVPETAAHPMGGYLDAGILCTLNADDPVLFDATILGEYELARDVLGFDDERLAVIARTSIAVSAMEKTAKTAAYSGVEAWLAGRE